MSKSQVNCPNCDATLLLGESLAVGQRIKCPKCQTTFAVPRMSSNGEGLSIHDPDMPVGHRRIKKKKKSVSPVALVASIMLSVVILAGAGFAGYVIIKRALDRVGPIAAGDIAIGKPAPEIEGEDVDGNRFKLSDYHGKVVVLDFWGNW